MEETKNNLEEEKKETKNYNGVNQIILEIRENKVKHQPNKKLRKKYSRI